MILGIAAAGNVETAPAVPVSFVAATNNTYATSTTMARNIPAAAEEDDLLLAWVMHRSAMVTIPSGWALEDSETVNAGGIDQYLSLYKKTCGAGEGGTSTTWVQTASARISVHIQVFRKAEGSPEVIVGTPGVANVVKVPDGADPAGPWDMAPITSSNDGRMAVMALTAIASNGAASASQGTVTSNPSDLNNRLAVAYLSRDATEQINGTFSIGANTNASGTIAMTILLG